MWSAFSGSRFYLDANAIIYALEAGFDLREVTQSFLAAIDPPTHQKSQLPRFL